MEKRSRYYLSDEAKQQVLDLPWLSDRDHRATRIRQAALSTAESRKAKLTELSDLANESGLRVRLRRLGAWLDMKAEGFVTKAFVRIFNENSSDIVAERNYRNLLVVDQIAAADIGKIGRH